MARYIDLLVDLLLVRRLPPLVANVGKRLVKSPKLYIRDSGLLHCLLGLASLGDVLSHPVAGPSWEGFALETLLAAAPEATASFYRTAAGAEIDLVLDLGGRRSRWAIEIKRSVAPSISKGLHNALEDLKPARAFIVHAGDKAFPLRRDVEATSLRAMANMLRNAR